MATAKEEESAIVQSADEGASDLAGDLVDLQVRSLPVTCRDSYSRLWKQKTCHHWNEFSQAYILS